MPVALLVAGGNIYNANTGGSVIDIWSMSLALQPTIGGPSVEDFVSDVASNVATWFISSGAWIDATASLEFVKFNLYDTTSGHQISDPTVEHVNSAGSVRGSHTPSVRQPFTHTYKVSMDDSTRSPRHRGGFYVPRCAAETQSDGLFSATDAGSMADAAKSLVDSLAATTSWPVCIWSRMDHATHNINRIRLGRRPDVQRRRSNAVPETYLQRTPA